MKKELIFLIVFTLFISLFSYGTEENSSADKILKHSEWKNIYSKYTVDKGVITILREKLKKLDSVIVYFGFWCGDSRNNVPRFIKLMNMIKPKNIKVVYISVSRKSHGKKYFSDRYKIERVPTFIFFSEEKEIGRIVENPVKSLPEDILNIIF